MTTIAHATAQAAEPGGYTFLIGILIIVGFAVIVLFFGLPAIRRIGTSQGSLPPSQFVTPEKISVNIQPAQ